MHGVFSAPIFVSGLSFSLRSGALLHVRFTALRTPGGPFAYPEAPLVSPSLLSVLLKMPLSAVLGVCCVLAAVLLFLGALAWRVTRDAKPEEIPPILEAFSHVITALCGLLPWGRRNRPPTPEPSAAEESQRTEGTTVVLMRSDSPESPGTVVRRAEQ